LQEFSKGFPKVAIPLDNKGVYEFGKFRLDPADHLLMAEGNPVSLTPKAFETLLVLVQSGGRLMTKEELMKRVWPDSFVEEANLTVNISALRKALGDTAEGQQYIETVPKRGYRFAVAVTETSVNTEPTLEAPVPATGSGVQMPVNSSQLSGMADHTPAAPHTIWHRLRTAALPLIMLAIVVLGYVAYRGQPGKKISGGSRRLAVLPFQNLRGNPNDDFLGFSLADAVITRLGYVSRLAVRPSYAVQKYRNQTIDISKVASELDVDTLLTGTFLHDGDDLRISCQLIDVNTQNLLWKGAFDRKYEKLLTVEDSLTQQIISELAVPLSPSEAERLKPDQAISPLAYEYYLRGVDLYSKNDFPMAIKMLEKSAEIEPDYALTWAHLGRSYTANASFQLEGGRVYREAEAAFDRALSIQPDQIDVRIYKANLYTDTGKVEKAVPLLREALAKNPNHAEIHWELGYAYRFGGMLLESIAEAEHARQLDPGVKLNSSTVNSYLYLGQYDKFLQSLPPTDDVALIVFYRGFAEYYKRDFEQAAKNFDHAFELDRSLFQAQIGKAFSLAIRRQPARAMEILQAVETKINQRAVGDPEAIYKIAQAYAVLGDKRSALRVLRLAIENGFFPYPYFMTDPHLDVLRQEAEFTQLLDQAQRRHLAFSKSFF